MPDYIVLFDQSPLASSDAAVGREHIENTSVFAEVQSAKVAFVTAESPEAAEQVVYAAYNGSSNVPVVLTADAVLEVKRETVPVDEPDASENVAAAPTDEPVRDVDEPSPKPTDVTSDGSPAEAQDAGVDPTPDTAESVNADADKPEDKPVVAGEPVTVEPVNGSDPSE